MGKTGFCSNVLVTNGGEWCLKTEKLFAAEAHYHMNGTVTSQNCRILALGQPNVVHGMFLYSPKNTVRCGFTASFILGLYSFFNKLRTTGLVNSSVIAQIHLRMLQFFVVLQLKQKTVPC